MTLSINYIRNNISVQLKISRQLNDSRRTYASMLVEASQSDVGNRYFPPHRCCHLLGLR